MDPSRPDVDKCEAFDGLLDHIEDIDLARDFLLVGGLRPVIQCMRMPVP